MSNREVNTESIMANYDNEKKREHGRQYEQLTKDGTGSAASVGPGGTGDLDSSLQQSAKGGSQQSGARMDDLLGGSDDNANDFRGAGALQAGAAGGRGEDTQSAQGWTGRSENHSEDTQSAQGWTGGAKQGDRGREAGSEADQRTSQKDEREP
jgi:hypothetical protein